MIWPMIAVAMAAPVAAGTPATIKGVSAEALFDAAEKAKASGDDAFAKMAYGALSQDPNADIRSEARFRLALMLTEEKRYTEAALQLRAILDEKPEVARVRIELARVLALMGDEAGARRQLRQAQAAGLPPEVAQVVDRFANALRSAKPWGGSFALALAPDSNINRATDAKVLDTVIAPLNLSEDARARSGLGLLPSGQVFLRTPIGERLTLVSRVSGQAALYGASAFNDVSASTQVGVEWRGQRDQVTPSAGYTWRWYGQEIYARTTNVSLDWRHSLTQTAQVEADLQASDVDYQNNDLQDGALYSAEVTYERSLTAQSGASFSLSASRQTAEDPGYASTSGGGGVVYWRDAGKFTLFASGSVRRLEGDERLALFVDRRREWYGRATVGVVWRRLQVAGFSPMVRVSYERNSSTVGLYDYRRVATEFGLSRAF